SRFFSSRSGSAVMPSMSGIVTSRITTSGALRSTCSIASRPLRSEATTSMSGSGSSQRMIVPRTTTASSTTMTRMGSFATSAAAGGAATAILIAKRAFVVVRLVEWATTYRRSDQPNLLELRFDDFLVERLHDVFIGARMERARDMGDVVLGGAEHHFRSIPIRQPAEDAQELIAVHFRHVPVQQHSVGHLAAAD